MCPTKNLLDARFVSGRLTDLRCHICLEPAWQSRISGKLEACVTVSHVLCTSRKTDEDWCVRSKVCCSLELYQKAIATASDFGKLFDRHLVYEPALCQTDWPEMSFLLGTSVANQDFLEAGDMRQELCAEFSLPPEGQHSCKFEEHELPTFRPTFHHGYSSPEVYAWRILGIEYSNFDLMWAVCRCFNCEAKINKLWANHENAKIARACKSPFVTWCVQPKICWMPALYQADWRT